MKILIFISIYFLSFSELQKEIQLDLDYEARGELISDIGKKFIGKPYISHSLDKGDVESCIINLDGFDCVTFYETSIALSELIIKKENFTKENIENEITNLRYFNGEINGYESRLHYSSSWILENTKRNKFEDITRGLGGIKFSPNVYFMSKNPNKYSRLKGKPELTKKIASIENEINKNDLYYIPTKYIKEIESELRSGDIIFFKTNIKGLDYAHTGMVSLENAEPRLLHASSNENKVILDSKISEYLSNKKTLIGITILRPY